MGIGLGLSWVRVCDVCNLGVTLEEVRCARPMPTYPICRLSGVVGPRPRHPDARRHGACRGARKGIRLGLSWVRVCDECGLGATLAEVWCAPPTPTHPIRRPKAVDGRRPRCPIGRRRGAWRGPRMGIGLGLSWVRVCDECSSGATLNEVRRVPSPRPPTEGGAVDGRSRRQRGPAVDATWVTRRTRNCTWVRVRHDSGRPLQGVGPRTDRPALK